MRIAILVLMAAFLPSLLFGQFIWEEHTVSNSFMGAYAVCSGDLNNDGQMDLIGAAYEGDIVACWLNLGGGTEFNEVNIEADFDGAIGLFCADINNDGLCDVLSTARYGDEVAWFENLGSGLNWEKQTIDSNFDGAYDVHADDIDGDGDMDVFGMAIDGDVMAWWENLDGGSNWEMHTLSTYYDAPRQIDVADMDGDGDLDITAAAWGDAGAPSRFIWFENPGSNDPPWEEHLIANWWHATNFIPEDIDNDGDIDGFGCNSAYADMKWFENLDSGGLSWTSHWIDTYFSWGYQCEAADIDGDGDVDAIGAGGGGPPDTYHKIVLWENINNGSDWVFHSLRDDYDRARFASFGDIDGDGDLDILGASYGLNEITWWEQEEPYLTISLEPFNTPIVIPPNGGYFDFQVRIVNLSDELQWFTGWTEAQLPNGNVISPLLLNFVGIQPYSGLVAVLTQGVPGFAPQGQYFYTARVGMFPELTMSLDSFEFTKSGGLTDDGFVVPDWSRDGWNTMTSIEPEAPLVAALPTDFRVEPAAPNPFNPTTTIQVSLPQASDLRVAVYNVTGQRVAMLASGQYAAGTHALTFDGSQLASGIYFVHAVVPGKLDQMQKVVLVK